MEYPEFKGKTVFISGGSAGVGYRMAEMLAGQGCNIALTGRTAEKGEQAVARLQAAGVEAVFYTADAGDYDACKSAIDQAEKRFGAIDALLSAGAEGRVGPRIFADMSPEDLQNSFNDRIYPRIYPVHAAIPALKRSKGAVVMITTDAARHVTTGESVIGATGAAIMLMTKGIARELSRDQVRVNAIAMTLTSDTPSWDRIFSRDDLGTKVFSKALDRFPSGRAPNVDEVAQVALFLASDAAAQVTGQTISVNGGLSFGGW